MKKLLLLSTIFLFLVSCGDDKDDDFPCSGPEVIGLDVVVKDAITSEVLTFGVVVTVAEGGFQAALVESDGHFIGLYDQQGSYQLSVTKQGYQSHVEENVVVFKPGCHSLTTHRTVNLQPL